MDARELPRMTWLGVGTMLVVLRFLGWRSESFQALAHLYEGMMFAAWAWLLVVERRSGIRTRPWFYLCVFLLAALGEVVAFLAGIGHIGR